MSRWVLVEGRSCRCTRCGRLVETTWRWLAGTTTWTQALCEPCVTHLLKEE